MLSVNVICSGVIRQYQKELRLPTIPAMIKYLCSKFYEHVDYFDDNNPWFDISDNKRTITRIDDLSAAHRQYQRIYSIQTINCSAEHRRQILDTQKYSGIIHQWRFAICQLSSAPDVDVKFGFAVKKDLNIIDPKEQKFYGVMSEFCFDSTRGRVFPIETDITDGDLIELQVRFMDKKCILLAFKNDGILKYWDVSPDDYYKIFVSTNAANCIVTMLGYDCFNV